MTHPLNPMLTTLDLADPRHLCHAWNASVIQYMKLGQQELHNRIITISSSLQGLLDESDYNGYEHYCDQLDIMEEALCRLNS